MKKIKKEYYFISILLICFSLLTLFVAFGKVDSFDEVVFKTLIKTKNIPLTEFLRVITHLASTIGIVSLTIITAVVFYRRKALSDFKYVLINVGTGVILMEVIKHIIKRVRPSWKWIVQGGFSYPSGHTISAFMLYGTLMLLIYKKAHGKLRKPLLLLSFLMIVLTALSRVYFGAHYLTDVLASIILGCIVLIISNMFMNKEFNNDKNKTK